MDVVTLALAKKYSDGKFGSSNIWDGVEEPGVINTSTGEEEDSTNGRRMPHDKGIAIVPGNTYYIKKTTSAKIRYTFYGAGGAYIGNTDALGHSLVDSDVMSQKMVPPVGATLFRAFSSGSMVTAGLTVAVGIEADLADVNESISTINRDLAELSNPEYLNVSVVDGRAEVVNGGVVVVGRLGVVNLLIKMAIDIASTSQARVITLPFSPKFGASLTVRNNTNLTKYTTATVDTGGAVAVNNVSANDNIVISGICIL